jgi:ABC-2 type transport system ATP-binding protein
LLCDEPTEGMDPAARLAFWKQLRRRGPGEAARTVVFSTHHLREAERAADRVLLLQGGRVVLCDVPDRLRRRFGSRRLRFRVARGFDLRPVVEALGVPLAGPDAEGWVEAWGQDSDQALVQLLGWRPAVEGVLVEPGSLDDVFLAVTGRQEEQA